MSRRELPVFVVVVAIVIAALPLFGGAVLWTRPFWLDEICCTYYPVVDASSPVDVVRNIVHGKDYAPPMLHLMVWTTGRVTGELSPVALRSLSLGCVVAALLLIYATLRRHCDSSSSAAGILAVASHSLVVAHAFEARFYGPWLLFAAAFASSLGIRHAGRRVIALAMFSIGVCSIHWFGILSLGLMCAGAVAANGRRWKEGLLLVAPALAGVLVLAAFLPSAFRERSGADDFLWIPPLSAAQVGTIVRLFFLSTVPVIAAILVLVDRLRDAPLGPSVKTRASHAFREPSLAALFSLALMPVLLMLVSVVLQPSLLDRYAILTVLFWAPLVALAAQSLTPAGRVALIVFLVILMGITGRQTIATKRDFAHVVRANAEALRRARAMGMPIVFESLHAIYPVAGVRRDSSVRYLVLPDSTIDRMVPQPTLEWLRRGMRVERNIASSHGRVYGFPMTATQSQLDSTPRFLLVASDESLPRMYKDVEIFAAKVFPHHHARRLGGNLTLLER